MQSYSAVPGYRKATVDVCCGHATLCVIEPPVLYGTVMLLGSSMSKGSGLDHDISQGSSGLIRSGRSHQTCYNTMQVDQSGRGVLTSADINGFLNELGLEPTSSDVLHIIDELDWSGSGVVSRLARHCLLQIR